MARSRLEWLAWWWRVACASYLVGVITMLSMFSVIAVWTLLIFAPLITVTLVMTRSRRVAMVGIPIIVCALVATASVLVAKGIPDSPVYLVLWFAGVAGPFALYPLVVRDIAARPKDIE